MQDFVHLHVHTQYSLLDGQASVSRLVDKAMKDGMKGIAVTDHGNMFGIKEFTNYVNKKNSGPKGEIKDLKKRIAGIESGEMECEDKEAEIAACRAKITEAENKLFKPIIGCEMYVARRTMDKKEGKPDQSGYHLIVLAKNEKGYHNLIKLVSRAWTMGYYMRPRTDRNELEKYHEGLIVCSACIGGEVPKKIINDQLEEAEEAIRWYKNLFGDDYYLELQRHKATVSRANHEAYPLQQKANAKLLEYARKYNIKVICSNDVHFVDEENAEAHDRLICLSTGKDLDDPSRMLYTKQEWMKTKAEMNELFADVPEALSNTLEILDKVEYYSIDHAPIMPTFAIPEDFGTEEEYRRKYTEKDLFDEFTQDENGNVVLDEEAAKAKIKRLGGYEKLYRIKLEADYLAKLAFDGAKRLYGDPLSDEVKERLVFELYIMKTMGFPGYFLIVQDFINAARTQLGVSVGPGRGSAAGSAVAYCLGITKIDPIQYDLLFERFLNPDRISLPDIDVDFDDDGRGEVLRWVTEKYGQEKVAHIITYGTMATKLAIKDVARVQKLPLSESDRLAKLVPDKIPDKKLNLPNAIAYVPELQAAEASPDPLVRDTLKYAKMLEGNVRGTGVHACGTIICRDDITDWVPVSTADDKETGEKMLVTQYEGSVIEDTGLIKMDFLGLRNLTILDDAVKTIREKDKNFTLAGIPENDAATYEMLAAGRTSGVFQLESSGMTSVCVSLKPQNIEDITSLIALYRPGPMESIPKFIACKHDPKKVTYLIPQLEPILSITYGCIVYQEQVIQIFQQLAGYSLGQADMLRRAMSKKKVKDIEREREAFLHGDPARNISGCVANGIDEKAAQEIYEEIYAFANYAFNKAHAAAYAVVAYQTAYFKCHYTKEYMAALLSSVLDSSDKVGEYFNECRECGIKLLPPDVNHSADRFTVEPEGIRFGLVAIKNIGRGLILRMMQERELNGPFVDFQDFCRRMDGMEINKRAVENLIRAGAFDSTGAKRSQLIAVYEKVMDGIAEGNRTNVEGQIDFFGMGAETAQQAALVLPDIPEFTPQELMAMEKATTGLYLTGHPMDAYRSLVRSSGAAAIGRVMEDFAQEAGPTTFSDGQKISLAGVVTASKTKMTKKNTLMAYVTLEDGTGAIEMLCFTRALEQYGSYLQEGQVIYVTGTLSVRDEKAPQLMCDFARPLNANFLTGTAAPAQAPQQRMGQTLYLRLPSVDGPEMAILRKILCMFEGKENNVRIRVLDTGKLIGTTCDLHTSLVCDLEERFGKENVVVK